MKEFKGFKVPEIILPETLSKHCDMMIDAGMCQDVSCEECIFDWRNREAFNEWKKDVTASAMSWQCMGCNRHYSWAITECPHCQPPVTFTTAGTQSESTK
jgi:hypothetical protein